MISRKGVTSVGIRQRKGQSVMEVEQGRNDERGDDTVKWWPSSCMYLAFSPDGPQISPPLPQKQKRIAFVPSRRSDCHRPHN